MEKRLTPEQLEGLAECLPRFRSAWLVLLDRQKQGGSRGKRSRRRSNAPPRSLWYTRWREV